MPNEPRHYGCEIAGYLGGAGTGKTTRLVSDVAEAQKSHATHPVLGLTFMHGARRRLAARLAESCGAADLGVTCETIDSFCLFLVRRFRGLLGMGTEVVYPLGPDSESAPAGKTLAMYLTFGEIRARAAAVIRSTCVAEWLTNSFACVVVDEFQDCNESLLEVVQALADCLPTYLAADEFQLLDSDSPCVAVDWLRDTGRVVELRRVHRTDNAHLLGAASALRGATGHATGLGVIGCDGGGLAAWEVAKRIAWYGWGPSRDVSVALICPTGTDKSPFFSGVLQSLQRKLGKKKRIGPFPFAPETDQAANSSRLAAVASALAEMPDPVPVGMVRDLVRHEPRLERFADLCLLHGGVDVCQYELLEAARRAASTAMHLGWHGERGRVATTIHGAKNREFDYVAVLWPYQVMGNEEYQRRLLYNAITRARNDAIVLVQGGDKAVAGSVTLGLLLG